MAKSCVVLEESKKNEGGRGALIAGGKVVGAGEGGHLPFVCTASDQPLGIAVTGLSANQCERHIIGKMTCDHS